MYPKGNRHEITKLMRKGLKQKNYIVRQRRLESYDINVENWSSKKGSVGKMRTDTHWEFSPTSRSNVRPFKPQPKQISESYGFPKPLGEIVKEYEDWKELEEIIKELEA